MSAKADTLERNPVLYVSQEGNDNNFGNDINAPLKTFKAACGRASASTVKTTIMLLSQSYTETTVVTIPDNAQVIGPAADLTGNFIYGNNVKIDVRNLTLSSNSTTHGLTSKASISSGQINIKCDLLTLNSAQGISCAEDVDVFVEAKKLVPGAGCTIWFNASDGDMHVKVDSIEVGVTATTTYALYEITATGNIHFDVRRFNNGGFVVASASGSSTVAPTGNPGFSGTIPAGVTLEVNSNGSNTVTELQFTDLALFTVASGNNAYGKLMYTFPAGNHVTKATFASVAFDSVAAGINADTPDWGVGSVIASGSVAVLGGTATFEDYVTGQTAPDVNGTNDSAFLVPTAGAFTGIALNGSAAAKTVHLNAADGWSDAGAVTATGKIVIEWTYFGA